MKKITAYIGAIVLGGAAVSCSNLNTDPVFDDANAFVEFGKTAVSVAENGKTVSIPVTLASLKGLEENISYAAVDGTAKKGTDFDFADGSATLKFNSDNRTCYIVINIVEHPGVYTGDLKFSVELKSSGSVGMGVNKSCSVTITDNDHPLADILGSYSAESLSYGKSSQTWSLNFEKDPDDVTVVHIDAITPGCVDYSSWGDWSYAGSVSEDHKTITISAGQTCEAWYNSATDVFKIYTWTDGIYIDDTEDIILTQTSTGVWSCSQNIWLIPVETFSLYTNWAVRAPFTMTKK